MDYFQRAAEAEYVKSLYNLGIIYLQGEMGVQDEEKAKSLIKRSAEKGDLQGKQQYIEMLPLQFRKMIHTQAIVVQLHVYFVSGSFVLAYFE